MSTTRSWRRARSSLLPLREHLVRYMPARVYPPGAVMAYSNYGTALAGYIVERVSGQPFEAYLTEHLLQPLGMAHSFAGNAPPPAWPPTCRRATRFATGAYIASDFEWTAAVPAAPIRTTATDISRFLLAHLNDGCVEDACILRPETVAEMHAAQFTHHPELRGMAYGFMQMTLNGQEILWHLGGSAHFVTMLALIPEQELGIVVSYNTPPADDGRAILFRFMDEFFPVERAPLPEAPLPGWDEARRDLQRHVRSGAQQSHHFPGAGPLYTDGAGCHRGGAPGLQRLEIRRDGAGGLSPGRRRPRADLPGR